MSPPEGHAITIVTGPPGSGKSHQTWQTACVEPGLYVFAYPTIALLKEQAKRAEAKSKADAPRIFEAHSEKHGRKRVQTQIAKHLATIQSEAVQHAFLLITHAGLVQNDFSDLRGWHWRVDEAPTLHANGKLRITQGDLSAWRALMDLDDPSDGWSAVRWKADKDNVGKRAESLLHKKDAFVAAAEQGTLYIRAEKLSHGSFDWISLWDLRSLPERRSLQINSASFRRSISAKLVSMLTPEVTFIEREVVRHRSQQPPVCIRYFSDWEATSNHWNCRTGRGDLKLIAAHIRASMPKLGFWSGNVEPLKLMDHYISGDEGIAPKAMGLNRYDGHASCADIYSAKPVPGDDLLIERFGLTRDDIRAAREDEDIFQFVYRGAIRRPDYGGPYDIFLFSRQQAERLKVALEASGLTNVGLNREVVEGISAGPVVVKKGRPKRYAGETSDQRKARRSADRKRQRAAKN